MKKIDYFGITVDKLSDREKVKAKENEFGLKIRIS